jgi:seryl-tRNA synthetase
MVKMKNISDFRQSITVSGSRVMLMPNDVIELPKAVPYVWLEEVPKDTPVTITSARRVISVSDLQERLTEIQESQMVTSSEEIEKLKQSIESSTENLKPLAEEIHQTHDELSNLVEEFSTFKNIVHRRLEIMKGAIMTLQQDFYEIEFDANGKVVNDSTKSES